MEMSSNITSFCVIVLLARKVELEKDRMYFLPYPIVQFVAFSSFLRVQRYR
jgi:hypothetical protein